MVMWRLSRWPWWKWIGNSSSPMIFARPPVAAMLPAVSEARLVRVDAAHLAGLGDQLAVLVDDEDALGVGVADQALDHGEDLPVILVVHHELGVHHRQVPLCPARRQENA